MNHILEATKNGLVWTLVIYDDTTGTINIVKAQSKEAYSEVQLA